MKRWFQAPRIAALDEAIRFTAETRKGKNDEINAMLDDFYAKK